MKKKVEKLQQRYHELTKQLASIGYILQGSIYERTVPIKDEKGHTIKTRGPYYQWTFKKKGKTVTINLSKQQAEFVQEAIDNHRIVSDIIEQMRTISLAVCDEMTEDIKRRSKKSIKDFFS